MLERTLRLNESESFSIARALFAVAQSDGLHEREAGLLSAFWNDVGGDIALLVRMEKGPIITPIELAQDIPGEDAREFFMEAAHLLAWIDGHISEAERTTLQAFANALGFEEAERARHEENARAIALPKL